MSNVNDIHPEYPEFKRAASIYLESNGYILFEETSNKIIYTNKDKIFVSVVNQRYESPEICVGSVPGFKNIQLGCPLEYYLSGDIVFFKKQTAEIKEGKYSNYCNYCLHLLAEYYSQILGLITNPELFYEWMKSNSKKLENILHESK